MFGSAGGRIGLPEHYISDLEKTARRRRVICLPTGVRGGVPEGAVAALREAYRPPVVTADEVHAVIDTQGFRLDVEVSELLLPADRMAFEVEALAGEKVRCRMVFVERHGTGDAAHLVYNVFVAASRHWFATTPTRVQNLRKPAIAPLWPRNADREEGYFAIAREAFIAGAAILALSDREHAVLAAKH